MSMRRDPVPAMSRWITKLTETAERYDSCVATVGSIRTFPGSCNVICDTVEFSLDLRSVNREDIQAVIEEMRLYDAFLENTYQVSVAWKKEEELAGCICSGRLKELIRDICEAEKISWMPLMSGAGHDCMNFQGICDTAMIFVPSKDGLSHRKEEYTSPEQCANGARVLTRMLIELSAG